MEIQSIQEPSMRVEMAERAFAQFGENIGDGIILTATENEMLKDMKNAGVIKRNGFESHTKTIVIGVRNVKDPEWTLMLLMNVKK
jgi:hypothetical protein